MRPDDKTSVPLAGIIDRKENSGLSDGARNSGGMTDRDNLKLWHMQVSSPPFWRMLMARIWRKDG